MPKRSRKPPTDPNALAAAIVAQATGERAKEKSEKNPAAVALGRLGGLKGGKARARKLTAQQRSTIAKNAARARWKERRGSDQNREG